MASSSNTNTRRYTDLRGFAYENTHEYYCTNDECSNVAPGEGALCVYCETYTCANDGCSNVAPWKGGLCMSCPDPSAAGWMVCRHCEDYRELDEFQSLDVEICRTCAPFYEAAAQTGCVDCGEEYSVGLGVDPTRCPRCVLSAQHPCSDRRNSVTSPVAELFTSPCGVEGCTTRALYYSMPPDVDEGHLILRCEEHYEPLPVSPRSICDECDRSESGEYADDCTWPTPARSLEDSRAAIAHIKEKLTTRMTSAQTEHWERMLKFREKELAATEAEMWAGYDADDLRKLDLQNRRGF